jgi:hypothetical protein
MLRGLGSTGKYVAVKKATRSIVSVAAAKPASVCRPPGASHYAKVVTVDGVTFMAHIISFYQLEIAP